jgi:class 3 adenylate cyclase
LGDAAPAEAPAVTTPVAASAGGERRHLTLLFCDLVGSTEIAAQLDPEEWRELVGSYHHTAAEAITRYRGHVAKYLGDGIMAYFGYPAAQENDAERAVRAGLSILDAIGKLNQESGRPKLSARIGIDSGAVVVGTGAGLDIEVFGEAPNNAARAQALAVPGTVFISAATHRLVSGLFVVEDRGAQVLKLSDRAIQLYRVIQPSGVRGRLEAAAATGGLTPFVGREEELRLLLNRWERALDGEGQVALIVGEAGIGKSRLLQHFHQQILVTPHTWVEAAAAPSFQNSPFYPVAELLRQFVKSGGEPENGLLAQLEPRLTSAGLKLDEAIPLIAPLLNLPVPDKYGPLAYSPEQQRRRLLTTMVDWILGAVRMQPLIIVTEDLHWADPSTLELIQLLVEQGATGRLLLLYTARPEFRPGWPLHAHHTQITLNRLSARSVRTMVAEVATRKVLSDETVATVVERTGGVPLFVEELTRALLETGKEKLSGREIPATLHDSLMARLDRLGPAKELAQVSAVIGGEFSYELIRAVHPIAENELREALRMLADADLLYVRGIAPEATYQFKHALIRDTAYEALLKSRRKELHGRIARTINEKFPGLNDMHPELLARHWSEADETERAIAAWEKAAKAAETRYAFSEALASYHEALARLNLLPESPERDVRELAFRRAVLYVLHGAKGAAAAETIDATAHTVALAQKTGNLTQLADVIVARGYTVVDVGDISSATALADEALALALSVGDPATLKRARVLQLRVCYYRGDLAGLEKHFAEGRYLFEQPGLGEHPSVDASLAFAHATLSAWYLGRADAARQRLAQTKGAASLNSQFDTAFVEMWTAVVHTLLREYACAETFAVRSLELAEKLQFQVLALNSRVYLGHALAQLGRASDGIALIQRGISDTLKNPTAGLAGYYTYLAAAQRQADEIEKALESIEQSLQVRPEVLISRPEALRVRGELRLQKGLADLAKADFRDAIAQARGIGAKMLELRTTISLARLLASEGSGDEARAMLAEIYNWFTEGFDIADLKDSKALLDELSA